MPDKAAESPQHRRAHFMDVHMMVMLGGRERNEEQFSALFDASGLKLTRTIAAGGELFVIEAEPLG